MYMIQPAKRISADVLAEKKYLAQLEAAANGTRAEYELEWLLHCRRKSLERETDYRHVTDLAYTLGHRRSYWGKVNPFYLESDEMWANHFQRERDLFLQDLQAYKQSLIVEEIIDLGMYRVRDVKSKFRKSDKTKIVRFKVSPFKLSIFREDKKALIIPNRTNKVQAKGEFAIERKKLSLALTAFYVRDGMFHISVNLTTKRLILRASGFTARLDLFDIATMEVYHD